MFNRRRFPHTTFDRDDHGLQDAGRDKEESYRRRRPPTKSFSPSGYTSTSRNDQARPSKEPEILIVELDATLRSLRSMIEEQTGVARDNQHLFSNGRELIGDRGTLSQQNLGNGAIIELQQSIGGLDQDHHELQVNRWKLQTALSTLRRQAYKRAHILVLTWQETDLDSEMIRGEIAVIRDTFRVRGYTVEEFQIPMQCPLSSLQSCLDQFLKNKDSQALLMIFYSGHAGLEPNGNLIFASHAEEGSRFNWNDMSGPILCASNDLVLVLDCCQAGGADAMSAFHSLSDASRDRQGIKHLIAASSWDSTTPGGLIYAICQSISHWEMDWPALTTRDLCKFATGLLRGGNKDGRNPKFSQPIFDQLVPLYPQQDIILPTEPTNARGLPWAQTRGALGYS